MLSSGQNPQTVLDADTLTQIRSAIRAYGRWKSLAVMNRTGAEVEDARMDWQDAYERYSTKPELLVKRGSRVEHTMDTTATSRGDFVGKNYQF